LNGLNTQQSLGNNQYPKTVAEANNVLSNHKLDKTVRMKKEYDESKLRNTTKKSSDDTKDQEVSLSFAQIEGRCYCCGKPGHCSPTCRFKNKPKEEWAINKAQQSFLQSQGSTPTMTAPSVAPTDQTTPNDSTRTTSGWAGAHINYGFAQINRMHDWILLDNQSS